MRRWAWSQRPAEASRQREAVKAEFSVWVVRKDKGIMAVYASERSAKVAAWDWSQGGDIITVEEWPVTS